MNVFALYYNEPIELGTSKTILWCGYKSRSIHDISLVTISFVFCVSGGHDKKNSDMRVGSYISVSMFKLECSN